MIEAFVRRSNEVSGGTDLILHAGKNLQTGERDFTRQFGALSSIEEDLLLIASAIFAVDRCVARQEREGLNRHLSVSIPLVNTARLIPLTRNIEDILRTLSHDDWRIEIRQAKGTVDPQMDFPSNAGSTLLFSGGLDSLAAAIQFGREKEPLQLVSHVTKNLPTRKSQDKLYELLKKNKYNVFMSRFFVSATSSKPSPELSFATENSQRTRSFLFATLGALTARRNGNRKVLFIAENGQLAVHLPLNPARAGAFSTHTAHPDVLAKMSTFFTKALGLELAIVNPFQQMTKAEVVKIVWDNLRPAIKQSSSCWMNARLPQGATHCGYCIPCIIRRIAIEVHGTDPTAYNRDLFSQEISKLGPDDDGRRNLFDLLEFNYQIEKLSAAEISYKWPELITISDSAGIIKMYKRAATESRKVLLAHPGITFLVK
jgi:7-cyano-7-deazaguanine synthase in queuosine biosynthesis